MESGFARGRIFDAVDDRIFDHRLRATTVGLVTVITMIAFEATEVASTHKSRTLVPVRPAEPLAGTPDRSPIPLADNVSTLTISYLQNHGTTAAAVAANVYYITVLLTIVSSNVNLTYRSTLKPAAF